MARDVLPKNMLMRVWWLFALRGVLLLGLAIGFLFHPLAVTVGTVWIIGIFWLVGGIATLLALFVNKEQWGWKLVSGLLSVVVGTWIAFPNSFEQALDNTFRLKTAAAIVWGAFAFVAGVASLIEGFKTKAWGDVALGAFQVFFGIIIMTNLLAAANALPIIVAFIAGIVGIAELYFAYRLWKERKDSDRALG